MPHHKLNFDRTWTISMAYKSINRMFGLGACFSCYTEVLQNEFISTAVGERVLINDICQWNRIDLEEREEEGTCKENYVGRGRVLLSMMGYHAGEKWSPQSGSWCRVQHGLLPLFSTFQKKENEKNGIRSCTHRHHKAQHRLRVSTGSLDGTRLLHEENDLICAESHIMIEPWLWTSPLTCMVPHH